MGSVREFKWRDRSDSMVYSKNNFKVKKIIFLRRKGWPIRVVARHVGCSPYLVRKHTNCLKLSKKAKRYFEKYVRGNVMGFISTYAKESKIQIPRKMTPKLSRVLGHLFFDGCVSMKIHNHMYRVSYTNSSLELVNLFSDYVKELFGLTPQKITIKKVKINAYTVVFCSKKLHKYLLTISSTYSTSYDIGIPKIILYSKNLNVKFAFLRSFWADEGSVCKDRFVVTGSSKSKKMIYDLKKLHEDIGISPRVYYSRCKDDYELRISSLENLVLFERKIGFDVARVSKGTNRGKFKKDILSDKTKLWDRSSAWEST